MKNLLTFLSNDPAFRNLPEDQQDIITQELRDPRKMAEFFMRDPEFNKQLSAPESKEEFIKFLQSDIENTWEESVKYMGLVAKTNWKQAIHGTAHLIGDVITGINRYAGAEDYTVDTGTLLSPIKDEAKQAEIEAEFVNTVRSRAGILSGVLLDAGANIATQGAGVLTSLITGNPTPALAQLGLLVYPSAYKKATDLNYSGLEAGGIAAAQTAIELAAEAVTLKTILSPKIWTKWSNAMLKSILVGGTSNAVSETTQAAGQLFLDYIGSKGKYYPGMTLNEALPHLAKTFMSTFGSSAITSALYASANTLMLNRAGLCTTVFDDASGKEHVVVMPKQAKTMVTEMVKLDSYADENAAQNAVNESVSAYDTAVKSLSNIYQIREDSNEFKASLESVLSAKNNNTDAIDSVRVSADAPGLEQLGGIKSEIGLSGKIVSENPDGTMDIEIVSDKYTSVNKKTILAGVPPRYVQAKEKTLDPAKFERDGVQVMAAVRKMLTSDKQISDMSNDEILQALGNIFKVKPKKGALGTYNIDKAEITLDPGLNILGPKHVQYVLAHEVGHQLHLGDIRSKLKANGFEHFITINDSILQSILDKYLPSLQPDLDKMSYRERLDTLDKYMPPEVKNTLSNEMDSISDAWSVIDSPRDKITEKIADFVSAVLNNPKLDSPVVDFDSLAPTMTGLWREFVARNPKVQQALDLTGAEYDLTSDVIKMFDKSDAAFEQMHKKVEDVSTVLKALFYSDKAGLYNVIKNSSLPQSTVDSVIDIMDRKGYFSTDENQYTDGQKNILSELSKTELQFLNAWVFYNRVIKDRTSVQEFVTSETKKAATELRNRLREEGTPETDIDREVRAFLNSNNIERSIPVLNPGLVDKDAATKELDKMAKGLGDEKMAELMTVLQRFQDTRRKWLTDRLEFHGAKQENIDAVLQNPDYARFAVAKWYTDKYIQGVIKPTGGSLSDICSPLQTTVLSDTDMVRRAIYDNEKRTIIQVLGEIKNPNYMVEAKKIYNRSTGEQMTMPPEKGKTRIISDGIEYDIADDIAVTLQQNKYKDMSNAIVNAGIFGVSLRSTGALARAMFTTHNPMFWLNNIVRDSQRSILNLPGGFVELGAHYIKNYPRNAMDSWLHLYGEKNTEIENMIREGVLTLGVMNEDTDFNIGWKERPIKRPIEDIKNTWKEAHGLWDFARQMSGRAKHHWAAIGGATEVASKLTAAQWVESLPISRAAKNKMIRRHAGTPILSDKGLLHPLLSNVLLFYNPRLQGVVGDYDAWQNTPGVKMKRIAFGVASRIMPLLCLTGLFGEEWRKWARGIKLRDLIGKTIVPLGITPPVTGTGRPVYLALQNEPLTKLSAGLVTNTVLALAGSDARQTPEDVLQELSDLGWGELPSAAPSITTTINLLSLLRGTNPETIPGVGVIPPEIEQLGPMHAEYVKAVGKHIWNNFMGSLYRFPYREESRWKTDPESAVGEAFETITGFPLLQGLKSSIVIGGTGEMERTYKTQNAIIQDRNRARLELKQLIQPGMKSDPTLSVQEAIANVLQGRPVDEKTRFINVAQSVVNEFDTLVENDIILKKTPKVIDAYRKMKMLSGTELENGATEEFWNLYNKHYGGKQNVK